MRLGFAPRRIERMVAVHEESPRRRRIGEDVKRQHVDLGVPEHVASIRFAGQTTRTDRNMLVGGIGRRDEVISREAERALRLFVSHDPNLGGFPSDDARHRHAPARGRKATCADRGEMIRRRLRGIGNIT